MKTKTLVIAGISVAIALIANHYYNKSKKVKTSTASDIKAAEKEKAAEDEKDQKAAEELISFSGGRKAGRNMRQVSNESIGLRYSKRHK